MKNTFFIPAKTTLLILILCIQATHTFAQEKLQIEEKNIDGVIFYEDSLKRFYSDFMNSPFEYVQGREYKMYYNPHQTSPLLYDKMQYGDVYYDGKCEESVLLNYDTYLDELINVAHDVALSGNFITLEKTHID